MTLELRTRQRAQPQRLARVDLRHPLAACLDGLYLGLDLTATDRIGRIGTLGMMSVSTLAVRPGPGGVGIANDGTVGMAMTTLVPAPTALPVVALVFGWFGGSGLLCPFVRHSTYWPDPQLALSYDGAGTIQLDIRGFAGTPRTLTVSPANAGPGSPICVIAQIFSRTDYRVYANGSMASGTADSGQHVGYNRIYSPHTDSMAGTVALTGIGFGRSRLTDAQALDLTRNPSRLWEMFSPTTTAWVGQPAAPPAPSPSSGGSTSRLRLVRAARAARLRRDDEDVLFLLP